jgi:murein L,D-transpeptidase YafK
MALIRRLIVIILTGAAVGLVLIWANWRGEVLPPDTKADRVTIEKSERRLTLYKDGRLMKGYKISLGRSPIGQKEREGDRRTPEGRYHIDFRKPDSAFHRALHISYPNIRDVEAAKQKGVSPGGDIMIHGIRNGMGWLGKLHRLVDWTAGCIAVTDWEIEEIWMAVPDGTPVEIKP